MVERAGRWVEWAVARAAVKVVAAMAAVVMAETKEGASVLCCVPSLAFFME